MWPPVLEPAVITGIIFSAACDKVACPPQAYVFVSQNSRLSGCILWLDANFCAAMPSVNLLSSFQSPADGIAYQAVDSENGDSFEKGVHTIRRKPVPSSSLHLLGSHGSSIAPQQSTTTGIPARTLKRDYLELISSILLLTLPLPFFALAFYSAHMDGKVMKQDQWQSMQAYMKVVSIPHYHKPCLGR